MVLFLLQFIHDDQFERGIQEAANLYAQRVSVYYYNFAYEGALYGKVDRPIPGNIINFINQIIVYFFCKSGYLKKITKIHKSNQ